MGAWLSNVEEAQIEVNGALEAVHEVTTLTADIPYFLPFEFEDEEVPS